jgi:hypothetical protein
VRAAPSSSSGLRESLPWGLTSLLIDYDSLVY